MTVSEATEVSGPTALQRAVRTYLDHLVVERGLADNTLKSYRRDLRRYVAFLADRDIDDPAAVREEVVTAFLRALREGDAEHPPLSSGSAARTVVAVRGFHKFAAREGLTTDDPSAAVRPPAPVKRLPKALPLADIERILDAAGAPGTALALRDRALLELLYGCGARISEAVGLDVDDLSLETANLWKPRTATTVRAAEVALSGGWTSLPSRRLTRNAATVASVTASRSSIPCPARNSS